EAAGAVALWLAWAPDLGAAGAAWPAVFHAVAAFCNAGFSVPPGGMTRFAGDPATPVILSTLVVAGGPGFIVSEGPAVQAGRSPRPRLSMRGKLVLVTSAALLAGGATLFLVFEWRNALAPFPWYERPFEALFLSAMPRPGGYHALDYNTLSTA